MLDPVGLVQEDVRQQLPDPAAAEEVSGDDAEGLSEIDGAASQENALDRVDDDRDPDNPEDESAP
jgi:hypothetical protein